ncbi:hypothetical protein [Clostridium perfringens]|uniref:hypothetical protein n=1 Tax=Clostridium perfringens TaxID=1502 RepID=UPI0013E39700|nr:hypothetical protein [Clostridium perfringens]NGU14662.1 hypothetical protein [Clostridium perfringens]NGY68921.1 hypothetical protein [Clostridium perfringens]UUR88256.1 hypothetical protein NQ194_07400 [Clostridium perfringens]
MGSLIKPEVYAGIVTEKFKGKAILSNFAMDLGELSGKVGDTVSFPVFNQIGSAKVLNKGDGIDEEELTQKETKATIKQMAAPGVLIYDVDDLTALGNFVENGAMQQGTVLARGLDSDLFKEALTSKLKVKTTNKNVLMADDLNRGFAMFGDEQNVEDMACIICHSIVASSFYNMPEFVKADYTFNGKGNGIVHNNCIGHFRGVPVFMSDKDTMVDGECVTIIVKKNALAKMKKRGINIEDERQAKYKRTALYADYIYAVKLVNTEGVVVLRNTIA